jgi:proteasome lid subunit RPN8/RPN11
VSRTVEWIKDGWLHVVDDPWPAGGTGIRARIFYRDDLDSWSRLPEDVELPPNPYVGRTRGASRGEITRTKQRAPSRKRPVERDVELRDRGFVDYEVSVGSTAREQILDEIKRAHRAAGEEVECGGWLFGPYRPRAETSWSEVAVATRSTERPGRRNEVFLSDPIAAIAEVRAAGYPHLQVLGDWHSHCVGGSELPSSADAKAWAGTMGQPRP